MLGVRIDECAEEKLYCRDYIEYDGASKEFKFSIPHEIVKNLEKRATK